MASKPKKTEADLWKDQEATAKLALEFAIAFLGCRVGVKHDIPLDDTAKSRLLSILRAVSIVESRHGTAGKNQPARDPIQCGNPKDSWWREFTGQLGTGSRFTRLTGLGNLWANELGDAAEQDGSFPPAANRSILTNLTDGHKNATFSPAHSYVWGTLYIVHRINTNAGDRSYQCGDLSRERLISGAVAYNGGGVSDYRTRIIKALGEFGDPLAAPVPSLSSSQIGLLNETLSALEHSGRSVAKLQVNFLDSTSLSSVNIDFDAQPTNFTFAATASDELKLGQKVPNDSEVHVCGPITRKIKRTDPAFGNLVKNSNPDIVFKDEEHTGADSMMSPRLKDGLDRLAALVVAEWPGVKLRVTEAWDENNEHHGASLHYEGRAADLTTEPRDGDKLGRLGQLAVDAGLDWVFFEDSSHVHASVKR